MKADINFESEIKKLFSFLVNDHGMILKEVKQEKSKYPQQQGWCAWFTRDDLWVKIGWNEFEGSLAVLIRFSTEELNRQEKYIYFEQYVEFISKGKVCAIVPFVHDGASSGQLLKLMEIREKLFETGFPYVLRKIADKLKIYFSQIESAKPNEIRGYHEWMKQRTD